MSTSLATTASGRGVALPEAHAWQTMCQMADMFIKSGLLPKSIGSGAAAVTIIQQGQELGIPPMQALNNIALVQGRITLGASLMAGLIYTRMGHNALRILQTDAERCIIEYQRPGWSDALRHEFTMAMAQKAGLANKDNWRNYPDAMLRARCISAVARIAFPDVIAGLYTPEEIDPDMDTDADGKPLEPSPEPTLAEAAILDAERGPFIGGADPRRSDQPRPVTAAEMSGKRERSIPGALDELRQAVTDMNYGWGDVRSICLRQFGTNDPKTLTTIDQIDRLRGVVMDTHHEVAVGGDRWSIAVGPAPLKAEEPVGTA